MMIELHNMSLQSLMLSLLPLISIGILQTGKTSTTSIRKSSVLSGRVLDSHGLQGGRHNAMQVFVSVCLPLSHIYTVEHTEIDYMNYYSLQFQQLSDGSLKEKVNQLAPQLNMTKCNIR